MRRASQRAGTPAQGVLRFVDEVLTSPTPELASRILGFPRRDPERDGDLLYRLFDILSTTRYAMTKTEPYCDALHTVCNFVRHPFYALEVRKRIQEGGEFCEDLFHSVVQANSTSKIIREADLGVKTVRLRADVYGILAEGLQYFNRETELHSSLLQKIFESFDIGSSDAVMLVDLDQCQKLLQGSETMNEQIRQVQRLLASMSHFVKLSYVDHLSILTTSNPKALGMLASLAASSSNLLALTFPANGFQAVSESLCLMIRHIFQRLYSELPSISTFVEEMFRETAMFQQSLALLDQTETRMQPMLRTQAFGIVHAALLLILGIPKPSPSRAEFCAIVEKRLPTTTAILGKYLKCSPEASETQAILFELMALQYEIDRKTAYMPDPGTFLEAAKISILRLTQKLISANSAADRAVVNAQIIFLSKISNPVMLPNPEFRQRLRPFVNNRHVIKVLEIVKQSRLFDLLFKKWPPEGEKELAHVRSLHPTMKLGLNLILSILNQNSTKQDIQDTVCTIFANHQVEFQTALKMGSRRMLANSEWIPSATDKEIASLIEKMVLHSQIQRKCELFDQIRPFISSFR